MAYYSSASSKTYEDVIGFIHNVSAIKTANNPNKTQYFNAKIQTGTDEYYETVAFQLNLHDSFKKAVQEGLPVKITNLTKKKSKYSGTIVFFLQ